MKNLDLKDFNLKTFLKSFSHKEESQSDKWLIIRNNVTKSGAPGNRTPLTTLQFSFVNNANLNYAT